MNLNSLNLFLYSMPINLVNTKRQFNGEGKGKRGPCCCPGGETTKESGP